MTEKGPYMQLWRRLFRRRPVVTEPNNCDKPIRTDHEAREHLAHAWTAVRVDKPTQDRCGGDASGSLYPCSAFPGCDC